MPALLPFNLIEYGEQLEDHLNSVVISGSETVPDNVQAAFDAIAQSITTFQQAAASITSQAEAAVQANGMFLIS